MTSRESPTGDAAAGCARPRCTKPAVRGPYCDADWRNWRLTGKGGLVGPAAASARVTELRALGWTYDQIAVAAGVSKAMVFCLAQGTQGRVRAGSRDAILRVRPGVVESQRGADVTGTRRRVQALAWMGWPGREVSRRAGVRSLPSMISQGRVSVRVAVRVRAVYAELSGTRGPSALAARKARELGFAPPAAWDDIDDPSARPLGVLRGEGRRGGGRARPGGGLRPHGTPAAIKRHKRAGERLCPLCREGHAAAEQARTARRREAAAAEEAAA